MPGVLPHQPLQILRGPAQIVLLLLDPTLESGLFVLPLPKLIPVSRLVSEEVVHLVLQVVHPGHVSFFANRRLLEVETVPARQVGNFVVVLPPRLLFRVGDIRSNLLELRHDTLVLLGEPFDDHLVVRYQLRVVLFELPRSSLFFFDFFLELLPHFLELRRTIQQLPLYLDLLLIPPIAFVPDLYQLISQLFLQLGTRALRRGRLLHDLLGLLLQPFLIFRLNGGTDISLCCIFFILQLRGEAFRQPFLHLLLKPIIPLLLQSILKFSYGALQRFVLAHQVMAAMSLLDPLLFPLLQLLHPLLL
mmetsp:Transcript_17996/g.43245  ORF Transcript_17996/g.43245 Transcript_17996/m.43245 type:complete len:304 (+) Transcript_17996:2110-3021(+)